MTVHTDTEAWVEKFLTGLLELAGFDLQIEEMSLDDDDVLCVGLAGPDSARAIGRDGTALDALQHLIIAAAIHAGLANRRVLLDIEHYRERREQRLREEALNVAEEVIEGGKPFDFEPMSARERRVIHLTVANMRGVASESHGDGDERSVRLVPTAK